MVRNNAKCCLAILLTAVASLATRDSAEAQRKKKDSLYAEAKVWDVETGKVKVELKSGEEKGCAVAFSPDGTMVALATEWDLFLFDAAKGSVLSRHQQRKYGIIHDVAFSPNGKIVALAGMYGITTLYNISTKKTKMFYWDPKYQWGIQSLGFSKDGNLLILAGFTTPRFDGAKEGDNLGKVELMDVTTGKTVYKIEESAKVWQARVSPNSKWIAVVCDGGPVKIYDYDTKKELITLDTAGRLAYSADSKTLVTSKVSVWDTATGKNRLTFRPPVGSAHCIALSPDGTVVATGGWGTDPAIQLWDTTTGKPIRAIKGSTPGSMILSLAFSPDGKTLACAGFYTRDEKKQEGVPGNGGSEESLPTSYLLRVIVILGLAIAALFVLARSYLNKRKNAVLV